MTKPDSKPTFRVYGTVRVTPRPFGRLRITALDRDMRRMEHLGQKMADADGSYDISYSAAQGRRAELGRVDLVVLAEICVPGEKDQWIEVARSAVMSNAPSLLQLDLSADLPRIGTEWGRLAAAMPVLLEGQDLDLTDLRQQADQDDITFAADETGEVPAAVEAFVIAARLAKVTGVDPVVAYAALREGLLQGFDPSRLASFRLAVTLQTPTEVLARDLACIAPDVLAAAVARAIRRQVVPETARDALKSAQIILNANRSDARSWHQTDGLAQLVATLGRGLDPKRLGRLAKTLRSARPKGLVDLVTILREDLAQDAAESPLDLAVLAGFDPCAVGALKRKLGLSDAVNMADTAQRIARASLDEVTQTIAGGEKIDSEVLAALRQTKTRLDATHFTAAFAGHLARDTAMPMAARDAVVRFLDENPDFDLRRDHVGRAIAGQSKPDQSNPAQVKPAGQQSRKPVDPVAPAVAGADGPLAEALMGLQRMVRLTEDYGQLRRLADLDLTSAHAIVALSEEGFVERLAQDDGGIDASTARRIYAKARAQRDGAVLLASEMRALQGSVTAPMTATGGGAAAGFLERVAADFPDLTTLFGPGDVCSCGHCRSVWSPGAYLVDALAFLRRRRVRTAPTVAFPNGTVGDAWAVLMERRPDILDIDLSCENAEVEFPQIDLVCELLENLISPDAGVAVAAAAPPAGPVLSAFRTALAAAGIAVGPNATLHGPRGTAAAPFHILRDPSGVWKLRPAAAGLRAFRLPQTLDGSDTLRTGPVEVNAAAQGQLAASMQGFGLPFDLALCQSRAWSAALGAPRADVLALFATGADRGPLLAAERLNVTRAEFDHLAGLAPVAASTLWTTPGAALPALGQVSLFLVKSGLDFDGLQALLATGFLGAGALSITRPVPNLADPATLNPCDTSRMTISGLDLAALDKAHRFLRLQRRTGWPISLLDAAVMAPRLGAGQLDAAGLQALGALMPLLARTGLPLDEALVLFGALSAGDEASLHARWFGRAPRVPALGLASLRANAARALADPARVTLAQRAADIAVAIGQPPAVTDALIAAAAVRAASDSLSLRSLAEVLAPVILARVAGIGVADVLRLAARLGMDPFTGPDATLAFLDVTAHLAALGLGVTDLDHRMAFAAPDSAARGLGEAAATAVLRQIAEASARAEAEATGAAATILDQPTEAEALTAVTGTLALTASLRLAVAGVHDGAALVNGKSPSAFVTEDLAPALAGPNGDAAILAAMLRPAATAIAAANATTVAAARAEWRRSLAICRTVVAAQAAAIRAALTTTLKLEPDVADVILAQARLRQPAAAGAPLLRVLLCDSALVARAGRPVAADTSVAGFANHRGALRLAHAIAGLMRELKLTATDLAWLLRSGSALGLIAPDALPWDTTFAALPFAGFRTLLATLRLSAVGPGGPLAPASGGGLAAVLDATLQPGATTAQVLAAMAGWSGHAAADLVAVDAALGLSSGGVAALRDPAVLMRLDAAMRLLRRTRLDRTTATALCMAAPTFDTAHAVRDALRRTTDPTSWTAVAEAAMAPVRLGRRDAAVAWLLANQPAMTDANDLADYLLIDVQMQPCAMTSRLVSARSSIQLFMQRVLMGLEPRAIADTTGDRGWDEWKWMKNEQVWVANRKVFVHPENWIDPELIGDESDLFKELRDTLHQGDLSPRAVEQATETYLAGLDTLGQLEVVACHEVVPERAMHVLARTRGGDPVSYFHRTFENERSWTPWTRVDLEIGSDQVTMFTRNGRLFLAWLVLSEEVDENQGASFPPSWPPAPNSKAERPRRRWKVQIAVSERDRGQWLPPRLSRTPLVGNWYEMLPRRDGFRLWALGFGDVADLLSGGWRGALERTIAADVEQLAVTFLDTGRWPGSTSANRGYDTVLGSFALAGCKGVPEPMQTTSLPSQYLPQFGDTVVLEQKFREFGPETPFQTNNPDNDLTMTSVLSLFSDSVILGNTPEVSWRPGTRFRIAYPFQATALDTVIYIMMGALFSGGREVKGRLPLPLGTLLPFFFDDGQRSYAVVPQLMPSTPATNPARKTFSPVIGLVESILDRVFYYLDRLAAAASITQITDVYSDFLTDPKIAAIFADIATYADMRPGFRFDIFHHPLVCAFRKRLSAGGLDGLISRDTQALATGFDFGAPEAYAPTALVDPAHPREIVDFSPTGAYSSYNWELFFHLPYLVGLRQLRRGRPDEAQVWLHRIFSPVGAQPGPAPQRWWVTRPFAELDSTAIAQQRIEALLYGLAGAPGAAAHQMTRDAIADWRAKPFRPHVIARTRPVAYMRAVAMHYSEALLAAGDQNYVQYTTESVNAARQFYVLADQLNGPAAPIVPPPANLPPQSFNELAPGLDAFSNAIVALENYVPVAVATAGATGPDPLPATGASMQLPYFCIPPNPRVQEVRDRIADRLFKIRHCRNIDGVAVPLALFAPPIDPGALVRAAAAGLDIGAVVAGFGAPLPIYRFAIWAAKATELAAEARTLSGALLSAMEKRDAEALARLRLEHEAAMLAAVMSVRQLQRDEAARQIAVLDRQGETIDARITYYRTRSYLNTGEEVSLALNIAAMIPNAAATAMHLASAVVALAPTVQIGIAGMGGSPTATVTWGSTNVTSALSSGAAAAAGLGGLLAAGAGLAATMAGYDRRKEDWDFQRSLGESEKRALVESRAAAAIRLAMTEREIANQRLQIANQDVITAFHEDKETRAALYDWMVGRLTDLSNQALGLAVDVARKAERCFNHELGTDQRFIGGGYWSDARRGLGAADALIGDLKRMEVVYLDSNRREAELSLDISLADLDPEALVELRRTGTCLVTLPEQRFDADHAGLYRRRLKSVDLSIPVIAGPRAAVGARLTLLSNRYRSSMRLLPNPDGYAEVPADDRFVYQPVGVRSVVTSRANGDGGMWETNLRDDRYLPFEGAGAISTWRIELTGAMPAYDRQTIADVVFSLRLSAQDGGPGFATTVNTALANRIEAMALANGTRSGLWIALDIAQDAPDQWDRLTTNGTATLTLDAGRFPLLTQGRSLTVVEARWLVQANRAMSAFDLAIDGVAVALVKPPGYASTLPGEAARPIFAANHPAPATATPFTLTTANRGDLASTILFLRYEFA